MKKKLKYILTVAVTLLMLFGLAIWGLAKPDEAVSRAERRKLAQAPVLTSKDVFSGKYMKDLETYFLDQFPMRDEWRTLKAVMRFHILQQSDSNGVYLNGSQVGKLEYPLDEAQVQAAVNKMNEVQKLWLDGSDIYHAIVPDKNYFSAAQIGYPHIDYDRMVEIMGKAPGEYIDLFPLLTLDDYYRTDAHWKQENLLPVAQAIADQMGLGVSLTPEGGFKPHTLEGFYGVYSGQSALPVPPDDLTYLTSDATDAATMTSIEFKGESPVYTPEKFSGMDGYDVFAAGPQALLTIESPLAKTDKELIIFRDSFGSSLSPLFLEGYAKVTLIDLRYVPANMLGQFVDFHGQDVLFLYSASLLNSGMLLK